MAELGWLGHRHSRGVRRRRPRLHRSDGGARGARPRPDARAVPLDRAARRGRRCSLGGSDAQKKALLPAVAAGERLLALAYQEPREPLRPAPRRDHAPSKRGERLDVSRREDPGARRPRRRRAHRVARAPRAASATPRASRSSSSPRDAPGVTIERQSRIDGRNAALVRLDGVRVDARRRRRRGRTGRRRCSTRVVDRATVGALRRDARRDAGRLRDDARVPEDAHAVRRADRHASRRSSTAPPSCSSRSSCRARR